MASRLDEYRVVSQELGRPAVVSDAQNLTSALSMFNDLIATEDFDPASGRSLRILKEEDWLGRSRR
jgi:hypothetical protein